MAARCARGTTVMAGEATAGGLPDAVERDDACPTGRLGTLGAGNGEPARLIVSVVDSAALVSPAS
jgi:hypothetical protein